MATDKIISTLTSVRYEFVYYNPSQRFGLLNEPPAHRLWFFLSGLPCPLYRSYYCHDQACMLIDRIYKPWIEKKVAVEWSYNAVRGEIESAKEVTIAASDKKSKDNL